MTQELRLSFHIQAPDGSAHELSLDSERALLGSDAHCEIRLPREHAAPEVILLEQRQGVLFGEVRSFEPPPLVNGETFGGGRLHDGVTLTIGGYRLSPRLAAWQAGGSSGDEKSSKSSPVMTAAAVLLVIAAGGMLLSGPSSSNELPPPPAAPALWPESSSVKCGQDDQGRARALAEEQRALAEGRRERAPFLAQDGVTAVGLFEVAAACFERAGDRREATELVGEANALRTKLASDFHVHRVRLERALVVKTYDVARQEAQILLGFLRGRNDEYVTYLSSLDRTLELKFSGRN